MLSCSTTGGKIIEGKIEKKKKMSRKEKERRKKMSRKEKESLYLFFSLGSGSVYPKCKQIGNASTQNRNIAILV
jgi:hypothetical protein